MQDTVYIDSDLCVADECIDIHLCACPDTHICIDDEQTNLLLDEMEQAYQYELWQCLQKLITIDGKVDNLATKNDLNTLRSNINNDLETLRSNLNTDFNVETISQAEVNAMWA